jgi:hypothetical protein
MTAADMPPVAPIYGHRCLQGDGKENTLEALDRVARKMQQPACEIDAWRLSDGRWVVVHDPTWRRTIDPATIPAGTPAKVKDSTWDQVRKMRTKAGRQVPTLKRFLNQAEDQGVKLLVEVKNMTPDALLTNHPEVWSYRQAKASDCSTDAITTMVQAGYPTGYKEGPCEFTVQQVIDLGVGLAAYHTSHLMADDAAVEDQLESNGVHAFTVQTRKPRNQVEVSRTGASIIVPNPILAEQRILAAGDPPPAP